jgi:TATA-binding protein-associated factor Taf7
MPLLQHLLDELRLLRVRPKNVRIPGQLYDDILADAEQDEVDEEQNEED